MSLTHNLSSSIISSSSSAFLAPTKINSRPQNVSLQAKRIDVCKCVATPQEEKIGVPVAGNLGVEKILLMVIIGDLFGNRDFDLLIGTYLMPAYVNSVELFLIYSGFGEAYKTKVSRNSNIAKLQAGYLFPEVRSGGLSFVLLMTLCY
ncbi:hypothetical protein Patl1_37266 [Pistacia atlantica]|nr:hypothetical protein Patl1_37266 [Pistacia atlantica]